MGLLGGGFGWASLKKGSGGLVRRRIQVSFIGELGLEQLVFSSSFSIFFWHVIIIFFFFLTFVVMIYRRKKIINFDIIKVLVVIIERVYDKLINFGVYSHLHLVKNQLIKLWLTNPLLMRGRVHVLIWN